MNRFVRFEYNDEELSPIDDYKNQPVLSLESALEPISSVIDHLDHYIQKAKQSCYQPSEHGLTEDESAAVYLYTDDWGDQSLNRVLNQILQSQDRTKVTPWLGFLKLFNSALEKLPTIKNTIWRGLPIDIAKKFKEKGEFIWWGVVSCSSSRGIIKSFLDDSLVFCTIEPFNGKDVSGYTPHTADKEVLLLPGIHLRVNSNKSDIELNNPVLYLEEISEVNDKPEASNDIEMSDVTESSKQQKTDDVHHPVKDAMSNESLQNNEAPAGDEIMAVITFSKGDRYRVAYKNGKKQGNGKYHTIDGQKFQGPNADEKANDEGICVFPNGDRFIGTFKHGDKHGSGILYQENGSIRAGEWANDELTGQSITIISSSDQYEWRDERGEKRWYGAYYDNNRNKYIGRVVDGKANGLGVRIWSDNSRYEGSFEDDKKHGFGIYYYTDRDKYMGQWANDDMNGEGKLKWTSGTYYKGAFKNGKRHGQGKLKLANKSIQDGHWKNDKFIT